MTSPTFTDSVSWKVERWHFSLLLEHWLEFVHLHYLLADTDAFQVVMLRKTSSEHLRVALTFLRLWIAADLELLDLDVELLDLNP